MTGMTLCMCVSVYVLGTLAIVASKTSEKDYRIAVGNFRANQGVHHRNLQHSSDENEKGRSVHPRMFNTDHTGDEDPPVMSDGDRVDTFTIGSLDSFDLDGIDSVVNIKKKKDKYSDEGGNKTSHLPQAIIIGVKKAGTRALLEYLRLHPRIRAPGPETHFFDKHYKKGLEWYRKQMPPVKKGVITMEKTPSYFVTKGIPERVYKMSKKTKLIIVFRDPVTRAISDFAQLASRNRNIKPFEQHVFVNNQTKIIDTSWTIVKIGVYAQHLARWLDYFPLRQMHFVSGEKLISTPAAEMKRIQDFLGVERYITDDFFMFNKTKGFPCYRKRLDSEKWNCFNEEKGRQHPVIDPSVTDRLRDFYRPFNIKLYSMIGEDYDWR